MRSEPGEQLCLDLSAAIVAGPPPAHRPRASGGRTESGTGRLRHRLADDVLASWGWPAGTELLVVRGARPERGEVAVVIDRGRRIVGEFGLHAGRPALRTDRGAIWLGPTAEVLGVVVQADAPLPVHPAGAADPGPAGPGDPGEPGEPGEPGADGLSSRSRRPTRGGR